MVNVREKPGAMALRDYRNRPASTKGKRARDILREIARNYGIPVADIHEAAGCLEGQHCHGPGCRVGKG